MQHINFSILFLGVLGSIDGSHVRILPPKEHPNSYCNRKKYHSVLLQGVCDHRKLFIDVYAGQPGSMHDSRVFEKSDLYQRISNNSIEFHNNSHLIGDLAYKLNTYLMVGFKNNGFLTQRQKNFNIKLSQIRVVIENAFGILKGRFRRLKLMETVRLDLICMLIVSACVLHNICILNGDIPDDIINVEEEIEEEMLNNMHEDFDHRDIRQEAVVKRNHILNNLTLPRNIH